MSPITTSDTIPQLIAKINSLSSEVVAADASLAAALGSGSGSENMPWAKARRTSETLTLTAQLDISNNTTASIDDPDRIGVVAGYTKAQLTNAYFGYLANNTLPSAFKRELRLRVVFSSFFGLFSADNPGQHIFGFSNLATVTPIVLPTYQVAIRSVNGGNYTLNAINNGVETNLDLGVAPVLNVFHVFELVVLPNRTGAYAILDGVASDPISTNMPAAFLAAFAGYIKTNTTSTASAGMLIDNVTVYEP